MIISICNFVEEGLLYLDFELCVFSVSWWRQFVGLPLCTSLPTYLISPCSPFFCFVFEVECAQWLDLATSKQSIMPWDIEYVDWDQYVYFSTSDDHFPKQRCAIHVSFTCMESHADISIHTQSQRWLVMMENGKITSFIVENFLGHLHRYVAH